MATVRMPPFLREPMCDVAAFDVVDLVVRSVSTDDVCDAGGVEDRCDVLVLVRTVAHVR